MANCQKWPVVRVPTFVTCFGRGGWHHCRDVPTLSSCLEFKRRVAANRGAYVCGVLEAQSAFLTFSGMSLCNSQAITCL